MGFFSLILSLKIALIVVLSVQCFTAAISHRHKHKHEDHDDAGDGVQPLSKIQILNAVSQLHENASIKAYPALLGTNVTPQFE